MPNVPYPLRRGHTIVFLGQCSKYGYWYIIMLRVFVFVMNFWCDSSICLGSTPLRPFFKDFLEDLFFKARVSCGRGESLGRYFYTVQLFVRNFFTVLVEALPQCVPVFTFYILWKHQKTCGYLMFSRDVKRKRETRNWLMFNWNLEPELGTPQIVSRNFLTLTLRSAIFRNNFN